MDVRFGLITFLISLLGSGCIFGQVPASNFGTSNNVRLPALLDNLQQRGLIARGDPCRGINCGPGRYCTQTPMGSSTVQTYQCRLLPAQSMNVLQSVPKCFDTFTIKVPATRLHEQHPTALQGSSRQGMLQNPALCRTDCTENSSCAKFGPGYTCCLLGCDRVCYLPRTTSIDYTNY